MPTCQLCTHEATYVGGIDTEYMRADRFILVCGLHSTAGDKLLTADAIRKL